MEVKEYYAVRNAIQFKNTTVRKIYVDKSEKFDTASRKIKTNIEIKVNFELL